MESAGSSSSVRSRRISVALAEPARVGAGRAPAPHRRGGTAAPWARGPRCRRGRSGARAVGAAGRRAGGRGTTAPRRARGRAHRARTRGEPGVMVAGHRRGKEQDRGMSVKGGADYLATTRANWMGHRLPVEVLWHGETRQSGSANAGPGPLRRGHRARLRARAARPRGAASRLAGARGVGRGAAAAIGAHGGVSPRAHRVHRVAQVQRALRARCRHRTGLQPGERVDPAG